MGLENDAVVSSSPGRAEDLYHRGLRLLADERNLEACSVLREAVSMAPSDGELTGAILYNLGGAEYRLGKESEAAACFQKSIDFHPGNKYAYIALRELYKRKRDGKGLIHLFFRYWRNAPSIFRFLYRRRL